MKHSQGIPLTICLTAVFGGAVVIGAVYDIGMLLAAGIAGAFICLILLPVLYAKAKKVQKILKKQDALVVWEYDTQDIDEIVKEQRRDVFKKSLSLSILLSICLVVIFVPFCVMSMEEGSELPPMLPIALPCIIMPWLSLLIAPFAAERAIRSRPCLSVIGRDYILVANRYPGVNDRYKLQAEETKLERQKVGLAKLGILYRFEAMRITRIFRLWVSVPVPRGKEDEAAKISI